jgi:hypothetical protein
VPTGGAWLMWQVIREDRDDSSPVTLEITSIIHGP